MVCHGIGKGVQSAGSLENRKITITDNLTIESEGLQYHFIRNDKSEFYWNRYWRI